jgi:hypothetical protein
MTTVPSTMIQAAPFHTTRWTRVCLAKADSEDGRRALAELCDHYYEPVVAYLGSVFRDGDAAREMSHAFFEEMLGGGAIRMADEGKGRFRSYLLGAVKHFVGHRREAARRLKRGGGTVHVSLEADEAVEVLDVRQLPPDVEFDRQWAMTVLARSMDALRVQCVAEGRGAFCRLGAFVCSGRARRCACVSSVLPAVSRERWRRAVHATGIMPTGTAAARRVEPAGPRPTLPGPLTRGPKVRVVKSRFQIP